MGLALLPSDKIVETLNALKSVVIEELNGDDKVKLNKVHNYMPNYWVRLVGIAKISVFGQLHQTTNNCESYHRHMKTKFSRVKPDMWQYLDGICDVMATSELDAKRLILGTDLA